VRVLDRREPKGVCGEGAFPPAPGKKLLCVRGKSTVEHTVRNGASCVRGYVCMGERAQVWMGIGQSVLVPISICGRLILPVGWSITRPSEQEKHKKSRRGLDWGPAAYTPVMNQ
jgi:hypothetical protein